MGDKIESRRRLQLIDVSFLPEDMKKPYKRLVLQRLLWLR